MLSKCFGVLAEEFLVVFRLLCLENFKLEIEDFIWLTFLSMIITKILIQLAFGTIKSFMSPETKVEAYYHFMFLWVFPDSFVLP
jgi:hypothetical protein